MGCPPAGVSDGFGGPDRIGGTTIGAVGGMTAAMTPELLVPGSGGPSPGGGAPPVVAGLRNGRGGGSGGGTDTRGLVVTAAAFGFVSGAARSCTWTNSSHSG